MAFSWSLFVSLRGLCAFAVDLLRRVWNRVGAVEVRGGYVDGEAFGVVGVVFTG